MHIHIVRIMIRERVAMAAAVVRTHHAHSVGTEHAHIAIGAAGPATKGRPHVVDAAGQSLVNRKARSQDVRLPFPS